MDKSAGTADQREREQVRRSAPGLVGTNWGYVIRPCENVLVRAAYGEMAAVFFAVLTGMAAYGQWLIPGSNASAELIPFKIAGTVIFFVIAGMLYLIARRNRRGRATPVSAVAMDDVERVFLQRAKASLLRSRLCVKLAGQTALMEIAEGSEAELAPILQRLALDLNKLPQEAAVQRPSAAPIEQRIPTAFATR